MNKIEIKNHILSAIGVAFFIFIALGSDEADENTSKTIFESNIPVESNQQPTQELEYPDSDPKTESIAVLNTDSLLSLHIENIRTGCRLTRQIWFSSDQIEIQNLLNKKENARTSKIGDISQISDALFFEKTYLDAYDRCVFIAEQIIQSENEGEIDSLITDALVYQTLASNALIYIQNPDLNYPRDKSKKLSDSYKLVSAIFADETYLRLPIADFKIAVENALPGLQTTNRDIGNI